MQTKLFLPNHRGSSLRRVKNGSKWKVKEISLDGGGGGGSGNKENDGGNKSNRNSANLTGTEISPALMAQANWAFVEKLLKVPCLMVLLDAAIEVIVCLNFRTAKAKPNGCCWRRWERKRSNWDSVERRP